MNKKNASKNCHGMTLMELAIVLGIVGLVFAAIWATGTSVRQKYDVQEVAETITETATRVRALYSANPGTSHYASTTADQIKQGLFPENVILDNSTTRNAFGGAVKIGFKRMNNWITGFSVSMELADSVASGTRGAVCAGVLASLQGSAYSNSTSGIQTVGSGVPVPNTISSKDVVPGGGPTYAYAKIGGGWQLVTNKKTGALLKQLGDGGCTGVAFYFKL